ncbi:hypothetical protein SUDANB1_05687 [Streptomyces sp. enrichment culture]|uniref:hypothetical protein n=1 Tax=Streptomyces sp. enrichment culture TaxID=1795815 RepID=UPI003F55B7E9
MARCQCGGGDCNCVVQAGDNTTVTGTGSTLNPYTVSAVTDCAEVRGCLSNGPGISYSPATGVIRADLSEDAGNNLVLRPNGLFVPTGAATVTAGCGLLGTGAATDPLRANTRAWPFTCDLEDQGGGVYCGSDGRLYSDPPVRQSFQQASVDFVPPSPRTVPSAETTVQTVNLVITNPDPCRSANAIVFRQADVDFTLPADGGQASMGIDGDDMNYMKNTGTTSMTAWHGQHNVLHNVTVPAGGTLTVPMDVTLGRGASGATWTRLQAAIRAWLISNPT